MANEGTQDAQERIAMNECSHAHLVKLSGPIHDEPNLNGKLYVCSEGFAEAIERAVKMVDGFHSAPNSTSPIGPLFDVGWNEAIGYVVNQLHALRSAGCGAEFRVLPDSGPTVRLGEQEGGTEKGR